MSNSIKGIIQGISEKERVSDKFIKREFVIKTEGTYPKDVCFQVVQDRVDIIDPYELGDVVAVHFNPESRNSNGRWFTNLTAWKIEREQVNPYQEAQNMADKTLDLGSHENIESDLPF